MNSPQDREHLIEEFELAWQWGDEPSISQFVRAAVEANAPATTAIVHELIAIDLEWRWKQSRRQGELGLTIEEYWRELSALGPPELIPLTLLAEEYRARKQWGDQPSHAEYVQRFPIRTPELRQMLVQVDEELRRERGDHGAFYATSVTNAASSASPTIAVPPTLPPIGSSWIGFQDYLLHEMIGAGQMGRVYRATHLPSGRQVAVKYLRKAFHGDLHAIERFLEEARHVSKLTHPGVAPIRSVGQTPAGGFFLEMELLAGPDLSRVIAAGPVAIEDAVRWTCQAAETIAHAHSAGIVHCDLKPGNLVLDSERNVRVTDFGLAQPLDGDGVVSGNRLAGTAPYMAPEQVSEWWGPLGPWTDVYGLGAVLYALLSGRPPFTGETVADILAKVASGALPLSINEQRPQLPTSLGAIVHKALSKPPGNRFGSAAEMAVALCSISHRKGRAPGSR